MIRYSSTSFHWKPTFKGKLLSCRYYNIVKLFFRSFTWQTMFFIQGLTFQIWIAINLMSIIVKCVQINSLRTMMHIRDGHLLSTYCDLKPLCALCSKSSIPSCFFLPPPSVTTLSLGVPSSFFPQASTLEPQHSYLLDLFLLCCRSNSISFSWSLRWC